MIWFSERAAVEGVVRPPWLVELGAGTYLQMDEEELEGWKRMKIKQTNREEMDIREELTEDDLILIEQKGKRIAHQPIHQSISESIHRPIKERIIERVTAIPTKPHDPAQTVIRAHVKESLFRQRRNEKD